MIPMCITAALLTFACVVESAKPIKPSGVISPSANGDPPPPPAPISLTTAASQLAQQYYFVDESDGARAATEFLTQSMNGDANPCDSFYDYMCANTDTDGQTLAGKAATKAMENGLRDTTNAANEPRAVAMLKSAFSTCVDSRNPTTDPTTTDSALSHELRKLRNAFIHAWPIWGSDWKPPFDHLSLLLGRLSRYQYGPGLMSIKLGNENDYSVEPTNHTRSCMELSRSTAMFDGLSLAYAQNSSLDAAFEDAWQKVHKIELAMASLTDTVINETAMNETVSLLLNVELTYLQSRNADLGLTVGKLTDLIQAYSRNDFDWVEFFNTTITTGVPGIAPGYTMEQLSNPLICVDHQAVEATFATLDKLGYEAVATYLMYYLLNTYVNGGDFSKSPNSLMATDPVQSCIYDLKDILGLDYALGRVLVEQSKFGSRENFDIQVMLRYVTKAQSYIFTNIDWIDDASKVSLLKKLSNMIQRGGTPLWIYDNARLDEYYGACLPFNEHASWARMASDLLICNLKGKLEDLMIPGEISMAKTQSDPTDTGGAFYMSDTNTFVVTTAFLGAPMYRHDYPGAVNFAITGGTTIGHETNHAFGPKLGFNQYADPFDNLQQVTLSPQSQANFDKRMQCLSDQYSEVCINGQCINGNDTLEENHADNCGYNAGYRAFKIWQQETGDDARLPGLEQFSLDQIFFMSIGASWCQPDSKRQQMSNYISSGDVHSPPFARVDVPLMNMKEFADAFKCKAGDRMNPSKRCDVW